MAEDPTFPPEADEDELDTDLWEAFRQHVRSVSPQPPPYASLADRADQAHPRWITPAQLGRAGFLLAAAAVITVLAFGLTSLRPTALQSTGRGDISEPSGETWPVTSTVRKPDCSGLGCTAGVTSTTEPVDRRTVTAEWGALLADPPPPTSCPPGVCYEIWVNWSGFPADQNVTVECRDRSGTFASFTQNTGGGAGRVTACFSAQDRSDIYVVFGDVRSSPLPGSD